ncbi:hypothetical protein GCM10009760_28280 [Kitasatospora kazusensis]|uniref:Uncharacterized protein n=1 Tax=Kitasatospora kazusensis TaxID=407974 RepID=A0ABP5LBR6_9ACTN
MVVRKPAKVLVGSLVLACLGAGGAIAFGGAEAGSTRAVATAAMGGAAGAAPTVSASPRGASPVMKLSGFDGPVTPDEIKSFRSYVQTLTPAADNIGNQWAQGHSGEDTKAMGLVYEVSADRAVLDRMIGFCDAVLSERDDLAARPVGQHVLWTGKVGPAWPDDVAVTPVATGGEQGDPVGHLADCGRLVLQTPALWHQPVTTGDPHGYGATYLDRAKRFVAEADAAVDRHILARLLDVSKGDRQYFAADSPYKGGQPVPWNQQMMFDYGFQNLAVAHQLLGDDPQRVKRYDLLVQTSVDWFFSQVRKYTDHAGKPAYAWVYAPSTGDPEDNDHGSLDCAGLYRAYLSGRYGITPAMMAPLANTFVDVMTKGPRHYAGRVDGTDGTGNSAPTADVRSGWLLMAEFRPDAYQKLMAADFPQGTTTADDQFSRALMLKFRRNKPKS